MEEGKIVSLETKFKNFEVEVSWDITMRCNYSCSYCESYDNSQPTYFKNLNIYKESLTYLKDYLGNKRAKIDVLGGEPLLYKNWASLLNIIYELDFIPKITTNLSIGKKSLKNSITNLLPKQCIDVSYHAQFAKPDEMYEKIKLIYESGHLRSVSIMGDTKYWEDVIAMLNRLKNIPKVSIAVIKDEARNETKIAKNLIQYTDEQKAIIIESNDQAEYFETTINDSFKIYSINDFFTRGLTNFKGMKCEVGINRLHIKPNGDVYPSACLLNYPKAIMGNLYRKNLKKPKNSIICPFNFCGCGPDMRVNKYA